MRLAFLLAALVFASCGSSGPRFGGGAVLAADPACPPEAEEGAAAPSPARVACLQSAALRELVAPVGWAPPRVQFGLSARRLSGLLYGKPWEGCAAGVASDPIHVSLADGLGRAERLVAWEYTNAVLGSLRRPDLWDNAYVSSVVSRVGAQIGGWSQ